jgi:hypothetical protein
VSFAADGFELMSLYPGLPMIQASHDLDAFMVGPGKSLFIEGLEGRKGFELFFDYPLVRIRVAELLGGIPTPYYSHLLITGPGGVPVTANWHQDNQPPKGPGVKAHFYLSSVDRLEDGPVEIAPGSWGEPTPPVHRGVKLYVKAGEVLIMRPDVWHRSTPVGENGRTRKTVHVSYWLAK